MPAQDMASQTGRLQTDVCCCQRRVMQHAATERPSPEENPNSVELSNDAVSTAVRFALLGLERWAIIAIAEAPIGGLSWR